MLLRRNTGDNDRDRRDEKQRSDDAPPPPQKGRRRTRNNRDNVPNIEDGNGVVQLLESSLNVLTAPVAIFSYQLPIVYPLTIFVAINIVPLSTWVLSTVFFAIYLWLGTAVLSEPTGAENGIGGNNNQNGMLIESGGEADDKDVGIEILPLAAFAASGASAALLSPQGLVMKSESWFSDYISTFSLSAVLLAFGWALFTDVRTLGDKEELLEIKERQERVVRGERRRMDQWDEDLDEKSA